MVSTLIPQAASEAPVATPDVAITAGELSGPVCVSCGRPSDSAYCPHCGERRATDRRYTLRAFATEAFETFSNADSTLWRTIRTLLRQPGELTRAYMEGRRIPYMRPLQLFLIVNVLYFVWAAWAGERVFTTRLSGHLQNSNYGETARSMIIDKLELRGVPRDSANRVANRYAEKFDIAAEVQAKTLIITMVPMFAAMVALVGVRRRRPALQHLVFALHAYTAMLLFAIVQRYAVAWPTFRMHQLAHGTGDPEHADALANSVVGLAMVTAMGIYSAIAIRRAYGDRWPMAALKGAVLAWSMFFVLAAYRFLLFHVAFRTT